MDGGRYVHQIPEPTATMNDASDARLMLALLTDRRDDVRAMLERTAVDPERFLDLAERADIVPWLHLTIERLGLAALFGEAVTAPLAARRRKIGMDNLLLIARAEEALQALAAAGVRPLLLKGIDLIHRIYRRHDERTLDDVDLLVKEEELLPTLQAFERAGWRLPPEAKRLHYIRSSHHLPLTSPGPVTVEFELHWNLAQEMRFAVEQRGLLDRARPMVVGGVEVLRMDDHDLVAHLLLHHFTHYFDRRLKWAIDMNVLTEPGGFDWEIVIRRVREWGATACCAASLLHLKKMFPQWIPARVLEALPLGGWRRALLAPLWSSHPLDLFRGSRDRRVQLYLASVLLERPSLLPRWLKHRVTRDSRAGENPLDR